MADQTTTKQTYHCPECGRDDIRGRYGWHLNCPFCTFERGMIVPLRRTTIAVSRDTENSTPKAVDQ
jgi:hypothetical protein